MKDIKGYEGLYAVTENGQVWSYRSQIFLKPMANKDGYLRVGLNKDGIKKQFMVHRLVGEAYIPNPEGLPQIGHKDETRDNNCVSNLYWTTAKENCNYGQHRERKSKAHSIPIICVELNKEFESALKAGQELGIDSSSIRKCCKGKRKTAGGYHWQYLMGNSY